MSSVAQDELSKPLGLDRDRRPARRSNLPRLLLTALTGAVLIAAGGAVAYLMRHDDPLAGEPQVTVAIVDHAPMHSPEAAAPKAEAPRGPRQAADLEKEAGVAVVRGGAGDASAPGSLLINLGGPARLAPAPDARLIERGRYGSLPRIGADGSRSAQVYARPLAPELAGWTGPKIAILVTGLGIGRTTTIQAIDMLPPAVTLAFAPYGSELEKQVVSARDTGHEVMVQAPMEPFNYPDNDPGPHTMLAAAKPAENLDKLSYVLSRFPGFIGVTNFMGAKLTADEAALRPILKEVAARGLLYVDDGSSPRSLSTATGAALGLPSRRADVVIDASTQGAAIDAALVRLETIARDKGIAIGSASALPVSVERIARWASALEGKGIRLVPVSAAVGNSVPATSTSTR